jgi:NAD(P)-dependent dehydrogenase (short-subunit alcohol dehydrogenase family)
MTKSIFDIADSVVLISGASRGVGLEIARQFLLHGASVVIGGHDAAETETTVKNLATEFPIENGKARIVGRSGDIADPAEAGELVALALSA